MKGCCQGWRSRTVAALLALGATAGCSPPPQGSGAESDTAPADSANDGFRFGETDSGAASADTASTDDATAPLPSDTDTAGGATDGDAMAGGGDAADAVAEDQGEVASGEDANDGASADTGQDGASAESACKSYACGLTSFAFTPPAGATSVKLLGTMNGWQLGNAPELEDPDGDGVFELTLPLSAGTYQYKFVADGKWYQDPSNPDGAPDGYGGQNSKVVVPTCLGPLLLKSQSSDAATQSFQATFAVTKGPIATADLQLTVNWQPAPAGALTWKVQGEELSLHLKGLGKGIHDVRLGCGAHSHLLKVAFDAPQDWRDTILYFAMTDRFVNGDKANDAPFPDLPLAVNWQGGDFAGIGQRIDDGYFSSLGVGAIWISWPVAQPTQPEPGSRPDTLGCGLDPKKIPSLPVSYSGYHGYWPVKVDQVEPRFGTLADLRAMVQKAHGKGIRVLLDFTANHVHTESPWYAAHKDDGWFHQPAKVCADIGWDVAPVECWFTNYLADFDHDGPARYALLDSAVRWVHDTGVDGFRVDAVKHIEMGFVEDLRQRVSDEFELTGFSFWLVGETFTGDAGAIANFVGPKRLHGQFDFAGNYAILETFAKGWKGLDGLDASWRAHFAIYGGDALMSTFLGNHDIARFHSLASGALSCGIWDMVSDAAAGWKNPPGPSSDAQPYEMLRLAFAWLYAVPGIPLIYYGDEFGMPGGGDPDNRRMMRFGTQLGDHEAATLAFLKKLGQVRAAHPALRTGSWGQPLWKQADLLAFARVAGEDRVVVLLHRGAGGMQGSLDVSSVGWADGSKLVDALSGLDAGSVENGKVTFTMSPRTVRYLVAK